jgi:cyclopropane-fatty-acyl-phospholipid synthase
MNWAMGAVERGLLPDPVVRLGIRQLLRATLERERAGGAAATHARRERLLAAMRESPVALHTREANHQHYELPPRFFETVLGPRLKYSCALFGPGVTDLARAEEDMLALTAGRAGLADGQRILELGCGWGSLTLWMAERFPGARITAVSNSAPQRGFIESRAAERGLANVRALTADMNAFAPDGRFDRVVSVEMFEHMRNWEALLRRVAGWLERDGALFLHVFCHRDLAYPFEVDGGSDWMARYFFTGGLMPSFDLPRAFPEALRVTDAWAVNGEHYAKTCRAWLARQDAHRDEVLAVFRGTYGADAPVWFERWRVFFLACAELFGWADGHEWHVGHYRLARADAGGAR